MASPHFEIRPDQSTSPNPRCRVDVKFGIIVDVESLPEPSRQAEVGGAKTMIERAKERFDLKPQYFAADTAMAPPRRSIALSTRRGDRLASTARALAIQPIPRLIVSTCRTPFIIQPIQ